MSKSKKDRKEIRCKKCNRMMAMIKNEELVIDGEIDAQITSTKYSFKCISCGDIRKGYIKRM